MGLTISLISSSMLLSFFVMCVSTPFKFAVIEMKEHSEWFGVDTFHTLCSDMIDEIGIPNLYFYSHTVANIYKNLFRSIDKLSSWCSN